MRRPVVVIVSLAAALALLVAGFALMPRSGQGTGVDASDLKASDVVVSLSEYEGTFEACFSQPSPSEQSSCLMNLARSATSVGDFGPALAILRKGVERSEDMVGRCHNETHEVGKALAAAGMPLSEIYRIQFPDCRFGFYHGGMTFVAESLDNEQLFDRLPSLCADFGDADRNSTQECVHATGHLLTDRLGSDLNTALGACLVFPEETLQGRCADGVFMQAVDLSRPGVTDPSDPAAARIAQTWGSSRSLQEAAVLRYCSALPNSDMTYVCYTNVSQTLAVLWQEDYEEVARVCDAVGKSWRRACFEGIAASAFTLRSWDPRGIADACHASTSDYTKYCIASMAHSFGIQDIPERARLVCDLARKYEYKECLRALEDGAAVRKSLEEDTAAVQEPASQGAAAS